METKLSHAEQYKMLREEIMQFIRETYRTEFAAAIAVGTVYTWLLLHRQDAVPIPRAIWFVPPFVVLVSAMRCFMLTMEMGRIAKYLRNIEEAAFGENPKLPGWERFKRGGRRHLFDAANMIVASCIWIFVLVVLVVASWLLSRPSSP